jgi:hypothetical protein
LVKAHPVAKAALDGMLGERPVANSLIDNEIKASRQIVDFPDK